MSLLRLFPLRSRLPATGRASGSIAGAMRARGWAGGRGGRWHVAFAAVPAPVPAPGNGQVVGIDRGVAVSAALSTGELLHVPGLTRSEQTRLRRMQRTLARAKR